MYPIYNILSVCRWTGHLEDYKEMDYDDIV